MDPGEEDVVPIDVNTCRARRELGADSSSMISLEGRFSCKPDPIISFEK